MRVDGQGDPIDFKENAYTTSAYEYKQFEGGKFNIGIVGIETSKTIVKQGYTARINVTATNLGDFTQTFDVTAYYGSAPMETKTVNDLPPGTSANVTFVWDTTTVTYGNYTINAYITPVPGETETADNFLEYGLVMVTIPGDANGDQKVNSLDIGTLNVYWAPASGTPPWSKGYDPNVDCNDDGYINSLDIGMVNIYWGNSW